MIINYITKPYAVLSHGLKYITLFAWDFEGLGILSSHWTKRSHFMNIWGSERRETWPYAVLSHGLNYITLFAWYFEGLGILSSHLTKRSHFMNIWDSERRDNLTICSFKPRAKVYHFICLIFRRTWDSIFALNQKVSFHEYLGLRETRYLETGEPE